MSTEPMNSILVVDQEQDWREHLSNTIAAMGLPVRSAVNSEDALEIALTQPPALIVLDCMTREQGGFSMLARLQSSPQTRHIPVILVTAAAKETRSALGMLMNVSDVLTKDGFDGGALTARIANTLHMEAQRTISQQPVALTAS
jgi:CheY-like chemotaxis protein